MSEFVWWEKCAHAIAALGIIVVLLLAAGCGSGSGSSGSGSSQNFSNASLKGNYAFTMHGSGTPDGLNFAFFVEGGVFTADGDGNLTAITDDLIIASQAGLNTPATGIYKINSDGTGFLQFKFNGGASAQYRITLSDDAHFYLAREDGAATSAGSGERQDKSAFNGVPSDIFVFQTHDLGTQNVANVSRVGVINLNGGQITGNEDILIAGSKAAKVTLSGTAEAPDSTTGRGTMTIIDDNGTSHYVYYAVSDDKFRLLTTDFLTSLAVGQAEKQTGGPFSASSLNGGYVFGSSGEDFKLDQIHTVGQITADGTATISGSEDLVQGGNAMTPITINSGSSYTVDSIGRAEVDLNLSTGVPNQKIMYLVSPSRAYFLVNDPVFVEDGTMDKQSGTFTNSSMSGQSAFLMDGFDDVNMLFKDRVGTVTPNGSSTIKLNYVTTFFDPNNVIGGNSGNSFSGTYSVGTNGRVTSNFTGFTPNMILYLSSTNTGYFLQADKDIDIGGTFTNQVGP